MIEAAIPKDERERLETLRSLKLLDTQPQERFDRITKIATRLFNAPISTLTLVDAQREWFLSVCGLPAKEGPRARSFCGHALLSTDVLVIPDTHKDARFRDNAMVVGPPYIRFYAGRPLYAANGARIGVLCIKDTKPREFGEEEMRMLRDLSQWAELEINSRDQRKTSDSLDRLRKNYSAMTIHELKAPLATIKWTTESVLEELGKGQIELKERLASIIDSATTMLSLINDLLDSAKMESGTFDITKKPDDLRAAAADAVKKTAVWARASGIELRLGDCETIPAFPFDRARIMQVMTNLLSNALKFTEKGSITVDIKADGGNAIVSVTDTGSGVPKKDLERLFQPFAQVGTDEQKRGGTGLGLSIVKGIVEAHGGTVSVESAEGKGSTFRFSLPMRA